MYLMTHFRNKDVSDELLTVSEAAHYLKVSRMTIWRWCNDGRLPAFKIGREWRVHRTVLDNMMQESIQATVTVDGS